MGILKLLDKLEAVISSVALWCLVAVCFLQVVMRYCFNQPFSWPEEVMRYLLICSVFIGISSVMKINGHLKVEVIKVLLPRSVVLILEMFSSVVVAAFCMYTIWLGCEMTLLIKEIEQTAQSIDFPLWISWLPIPLGFGLSIIQLIRCQYKAWQDYKAEGEQV